MMRILKALAVFLAFYIVFLSGDQCIDALKYDTSQKVELSQSTPDNHQNDIDHCSPFCTCQCCQANFFISNAPSVLTAEALGFTYHESNQNFQSIDLFDFLIPPKS